MKEPKYTGPRKGYAAIWMAWPDEDDHAKFYQFQYQHRMRILSKIEGRWRFTWGSAVLFFQDQSFFPCWLDDTLRESDPIQIKRMYAYDKSQNRETVFLGYFKE